MCTLEIVFKWDFFMIVVFKTEVLNIINICHPLAEAV